MKKVKNAKQSSVRLPSFIIPERYKIFLKPDLEGFTFEGEETIYLKLEKQVKEITLHSSEIEIFSAQLIKGKTLVTGKIAYDMEAETATFTFPKNIPAGKGELKLKFKGILNDRMRGFYRSQYEVNGVVKHMATTQFESTDARRAFPCFDEPSQKAVFDVTLMIPAHTVAISNTLETVVEEHDGGFKRVEFAPTPKMSTYLLAFIVGEFEYIEKEARDGVKVRVFTTPGKKKQAEFALDVAVKCLEFYENYFGIKYPLPVLDLIAIPDFAAGAMENWGAVTYRESALLVDEQYSSLGNKQWVAIVIAHELAHQWFGNLVTMEWWTHLWLNEGFASYIEYLAIDHLFPEWDIWTQFVYLDLGVALQLDGLINTHPIEVEVHHPAEISEIFDKVSYSKGASIIRMLASYLGEKNFQKGLSNYLKKHQYSNASTEDLWESFEKVSGKPVRGVMKNWTSKPGYPLISVQVTDNSRKLKLTQNRFYSSPISAKQNRDTAMWKIPLNLINSTSKPEKLLLDKRSINIDKPKENSWIKLNHGEVSFVRVDYPAKYLHLLKNAIENNVLSAVDRLGIIRDAFALSEAGKLPTQEALGLVVSYKNEEDLTVWNEIVSGIDKVRSLISNEDFGKQFDHYGREIFRTIAQKMGWTKKRGEKHTAVMLRSLALYHLGKFGDQETINQAKKIFNEMINGKDIDPDIKGVVYNLVAENGGLKEYQVFIDLYKKETNQQEQARLARALSSFNDKKLLQKTLEFALSKHVRLQDIPSFIVHTWFNPEGKDLTWEFVQEKWSFLREKLAGGYLLSRLIHSAEVFTDIRRAKEIEKFFIKNPSADVKRTVQQVLEQIYSNADWLKRDRRMIEGFLKKV